MRKATASNAEIESSILPLEEILANPKLARKFVQTEGIARGVHEYVKPDGRPAYVAFLQGNKKNFLFLVGEPDIPARRRVAPDPNYPDGEVFRRALTSMINRDYDEAVPVEIAKSMQAVSMLRASSETRLPIRVSGVIEGKPPYYLSIRGVEFQGYRVEFKPFSY